MITQNSSSQYESISLFSLTAQDCSELFFSEYVEGSSNCVVEIYNPTDAPIDLVAIVLSVILTVTV